MAKLPSINGRECIATLRRLGFEVVRQRGSHVVMRCGDRGCVVPMHHDIKSGTLMGLLRQAGISKEEFIAAHQS